jgi:hypothetical protein
MFTACKSRGTLLALAAALALGAGTALASSHSEAPGTAKDRLADDTDVYAFVAKDAPDAVTFVGLWVPLLEPNGGPNFYSFDDEAFYYINIDNVGDCLDHIRYQFKFETTRRTGATFLYNTGVVTSFDDPDLNVRQTCTVTRIDDGTETVVATGVPVAPNFVGGTSMPDYASLAQSVVTTLPDGSKLFLGPRDDPFFVDLAAIFDLIQIRDFPGNDGNGVDGVAGYNAMAIVLQVPKTRLTRDGQEPGEGNSIIGVYDSVERLQTRTLNADGTVSVSGPEVQVSRLGMPLVNEVVIPLQDKNRFNASKPTADGQFLSYVTNPELPVLLNLLYGAQVPPTPRNDLVTVFLTGVPGLNQPANGTPCEMLRLNMAIPPARRPNRLGVLKSDLAGFPNGRRLADDVVDIELRVAAGVLVPGFNIKPNRQLGDGVDHNDKPFLPYFPYVALPHDPFVECGGDEGDDDKTALAADEEDRGESDELSADKAAVHVARLAVAGANPGRQSRLQFSVPRTSHVSLRVFDAKGRVVRTLVDQDAAAGSFESNWDGRDDRGAAVAPGVYFAKFDLDGRTIESRKLTLVR